MALNKAHTSVWVKTLIIILIVAFVSLFMYNGILGIFTLFQPTQTATAPSTSTADPVATAQAKFQPQVDALKQLAQSDPTSYTAAVNLANVYFDWANELSTPASGQSQISTGAMTAASTQWGNAKSAYDAATKLMKTFDPAAQTDRSFATLYASNDATAAIDIVKTVTEKAPTYAQAWFHLGYFYDSTNQGKLALPAYQKYLQLDPKGQNASLAQQRIKTLGGSVTTTTTK